MRVLMVIVRAEDLPDPDYLIYAAIADRVNFIG